MYNRGKRQRAQESNYEVEQQKRSKYRNEFSGFNEEVPVLTEEEIVPRWFPANEFDEEYDTDFLREIAKIEQRAAAQRRVEAYNREQDLAMQSSSTVTPYSMGAPEALLSNNGSPFKPSTYEGRDERHYFKQLSSFYERELTNKNKQIEVLQNKVLDLTIDLDTAIVDDATKAERIETLERQLHRLNVNLEE